MIYKLNLNLMSDEHDKYVFAKTLPRIGDSVRVRDTLRNETVRYNVKYVEHPLTPLRLFGLELMLSKLPIVIAMMPKEETERLLKTGKL